MLTIASVVKGLEEAQKALDKKNIEDWRTLAFELVALIPPECYQLADRNRWRGEKTAKEGFKLPEFLRNIAKMTPTDYSASFHIYTTSLETCGCANFEELKAKYRLLEKAWEKTLRIEFNEESNQCIIVNFFPVGLEPENASKAA